MRPTGNPYRQPHARALAPAPLWRWPTWCLDVVGAAVTLAGWPWAWWVQREARRVAAEAARVALDVARVVLADLPTRIAELERVLADHGREEPKPALADARAPGVWR